LLVLRVLIRDAVRSTDSFDRLEQTVVGYADFIQEPPRLAFDLGEREQQMLGRDVLVAQLLGFLLGAVEDLVELAGEVGLGIALLWIARYLALGALGKRGDARAELLADGNDNALLLVVQRPEQVVLIQVWHHVT